MTEMVRVVLVPRGAEGDTAGDKQIVLDMAIDAAGTAVGPFPAFGRIGDFRKPETLFPFTLMMDGRIDYGAHAEDSANQTKLQIRQTVLKAGAEVARVGAGGNEAFEIASVTPLVSG